MTEVDSNQVAMASPTMSSPATPEPPGESVTPEAPGCSKDSDSTPLNQGRGKKRHRRAKGKKKKQKTSLMITNEDGTNSTAAATKQQKKVYLRPSNNPLLRAPKNSTQFIIDDHENSNLFWNFDAHPDEESTRDGTEGDVGEDVVGVDTQEVVENHPRDGQPRQNQGMAVMPGQFFGLSDSDRFSPDDDNFWAAYSERDFESVYETAHQEEVYSWERGKIIDEISVLEIKQKQLINMLSQIDPLIYLQKLQHELLALQEQNRQLKLINIAERLERQARGGGSSASSPRLPDSTTERDGEESKDTIAESEDTEESGDESDGGGCSSGCCLADKCSNNSCEEETVEQRMEELEEGSGGEERLGDEETFEDIGEVPDEEVEDVNTGNIKPEEKVIESGEENFKLENKVEEIVSNVNGKESKEVSCQEEENQDVGKKGDGCPLGGQED